jgi:hypothetical protein
MKGVFLFLRQSQEIARIPVEHETHSRSYLPRRPPTKEDLPGCVRVTLHSIHDRGLL